MSVIHNTSDVIRIRHGDKRKVMLEDPVGDRSLVDSNDVVKMCRLVELGQQTQRKAFEAIGVKIENWLNKNHDLVSELVLAPKGDRMLLLAVMDGTRYNPVLEDRLTELDLDIAQDEQTQPCKVDVMAVPNFGSESLSAFLQQ